jgi:hypothetical protein
LGFFSTDELIEVKRGDDRADEAQAIRFGFIVDIVGRNHMSGARHILYDHVRFAGDMFSHMLRENSAH